MPAPAHPRFALPAAPVLGVLAAVVTVLIWSAFIVIARASADPARGAVLSPFDIVYARILGASLVLLPWGLWLSRGRPHALAGLSPLPLRQTLHLGLTAGLIYPLLAYNGFVFAPAAHASVLMPGSLPLWTALLAVPLLGERLTLVRLAALGLIVAGDVLVGAGSLLHVASGSNAWQGDTVFVLASMTWAVYSVQVRRFGLDAVRATIATTALAFVVYVPAYTLLLLLGWVPGHALTAPWSAMAWQMLFQGVGSVAISGITFTLMIAHFGPVRSTMITAVVPGLSALAAVVLLDEALAWHLLAGLGLVTLGIVWGVRHTGKTTIKPIAAPAVSISS